MSGLYLDNPPAGDKCPHCGSDDGVIQTVHAAGYRLMSWDGEIYDTDFSKRYDISNPRCACCGKAVRSCFAQSAAPSDSVEEGKK